MVHCAYQMHGGEDSVVQAEVALLREHGHDVRLMTRHNAEIGQMPAWQVARDTIWSPRTGPDLREITLNWRPDVMHVHNTSLLISPSIFWAARQQGIPVVQTLHNFRMACLSATFLRNGQVCERCLGRAPLEGVIRGCFRDSRAQSAILAASIMTHRWLQTPDKVDAFIALTEFARAKLVDAGLPASRVHVKPNFVPWSDAPATTVRTGALFVGRLTEEKGVQVLMEAQAQAQVPLTVLGTGPLADQVKQTRGVTSMGQAPLTQVLEHMQKASFLVMPSLWYEGFPRTLVEAFSRGLPVIASRLGSMAELIEDGRTGILVTPGDAAALRQAMQWAADHPQRMAEMGTNARLLYERSFSPDRNHLLLRQIYDQAMRRAAGLSHEPGSDPNS